MQKFAEYEAMVSAAVDDLYGERVRVVPRADGRFVKSAGADPSRTEFDAVGPVDYQPQVIRTRYAGKNDADSPDLSGELLHVSIPLSTPGFFMPKNGDRIILRDRPGEPEVVINNAEPDGLGRVLCRCAPATGAIVSP